MFKFIRDHWETRRERFYRKNRWHLILDFSLGIIVILMAAAFITLHYYQPSINWFYRPTKIDKPSLDLNNPPINLSYSLESSAIRLADGAVLKVKILNDGQAPIENLKTTFLTLDKSFSIEKITVLDDSNPNPEASVTNRQLNFGSLGAGESRLVNLKIIFSAAPGADRVLNWQAQSEYSAQGQTLKETQTLPSITLAAEMVAKAYVYYNSPQGDQLGSGPLPPLVGLPTNYWVFFESQSAGSFKDFVFSAKLAPNVEMTGNRSVLSGDLKYNAATRQIIWTVPEIKNQSDSYRAGFEVQFTPAATQADKVATLLSNIKYYAIDSLVNQEDSGVLNDLTSNLDFDHMNKGEGKIGRP
ncbi:MAG: hypothetical protein WC467_01505 [Patescibacteria group bacterium]